MKPMTSKDLEALTKEEKEVYDKAFKYAHLTNTYNEMSPKKREYYVRQYAEYRVALYRRYGDKI